MARRAARIDGVGFGCVFRVRPQAQAGPDQEARPRPPKARASVSPLHPVFGDVRYGTLPARTIRQFLRIP